MLRISIKQFTTAALLVALSGTVFAEEKNVVNEILKAASISEDERYKEVSMISLLGNPEKYDKKRIEIVGYLRFTGEYNSIYYSKEASEHGSMFDSVAVQLMPQDRGLSWKEIKDKYDSRYGRISGVFYYSNAAGITSGVMKGVQYILTSQIDK